MASVCVTGMSGLGKIPACCLTWAEREFELGTRLAPSADRFHSASPGLAALPAARRRCHCGEQAV